MPLQKLQFRPGVNREGTNYANEGGWYDCDNIRFRSGFPEKLGGWIRLTADTFVGIARSLWNWIDYDVGNNYLGIGTSKKYYIEKGGTFNNVTPIFHTSNALGAAAGPFTATTGSNVITITDVSYNPEAGDYVVFSGAASLGGNITADILNQEYIVATVPTNTTYTIVVSVNANASDTLKGGATVKAEYEYPVGLDVYTIGTGWGAGPWSPSSPILLGANPLATTNNSGTVVITQTAHGLVTGNYVVITGATTTNGIPAAVLNTTFNITYLTANTYSIKTPGSLPNNSDAGTIIQATSTGTGGGSSVVIYPQTGARGWGTEYSTGIGQQLRLWSNDNFGQDLVIAPRGGGIYYWKDSSGVTVRAKLLNTLADDEGFDGDYVPNKTNQISASSIQRFLIAFGANSYLPGTPNTPFNPMLVRWSDQENPYEWVPAITNQSGEFTLTHGSSIIASIPTRQELLVWTDSALYSMQYLGAPYVWGFNLLMDNISVMSPNSMITVNNVTYWMGVDKFYMYSGRVETLPCSLRQYIFNDLNRDQSYQVFAGGNEAYNEVWWFYVSNSSNSTDVDKYVIYNYLDRVWYYGSMARTAWLDSGIRPYPMAANYDNRVLYHEASVDDVSGLTPVPIASYIQSSDFDIGDGHNFGFVWRILPDVNFNGSNINGPSVTMTVKPRVNSGAPYGAANNPAVPSQDNFTIRNTYNIQEFTGQVYTRIRGRQMSFRIESDGLGVAWQLGSPRIDIRPDGRR
jgi:hypothetical protein